MMAFSKYLSIGVLSAALVLTGCATVPPGPATGLASETPTGTASAAGAASVPSYLFAVNAEAGTISGVGKDTGTEKLTLTLTKAASHATQFADRPIRAGYVLATQDLVAQWDSWFVDSPPNAVLTFRTAKDPMPHSIVLTLTEPFYDASADTLSFAATHVHRELQASPDGTTSVQLPHTTAPASFVSGSLFIDNVTLDAPWTIRWADRTVWEGVTLTTVQWQCSFNAGKINELDFDRTGAHDRYTGGYPYENACSELDYLTRAK